MSLSDPLFDEEDLNNPDFRCPHGTFIGNPYGADYMCGACESGISMEEWRAGVLWEENRRRMHSTALNVLQTWGDALDFVDELPGHRQLIVGMFVTMAKAAR